uniref:Protein kinase domain-containing protein n=1 Tax=Rhizophora mucronata TaxID=61149 RepID=A0A2P2M003_RHIMU
MERNVGTGMMDQTRSYEQIRVNNADARNDRLGSANQRFFCGPSTNISSIQPPDYNISSGARPVLNYSFQTGEEFALEFMRERVNPRQRFFPNAYGDSNSAPGYMELKSMLGIPHTSSENGPDIPVPSTAEKGYTLEFERKSSAVHEQQHHYDSIKLVPQTSPRNESTQGIHEYASSGTSDGSSMKVKFLCSFGGTIMPRPSDGKLRYVGGETRMIRLSKNVSWQDLTQKISAIYNQAHTIKYQLPGEDLDALVSVSCDEDLQNMMEECNVIEDGGLQKPRMFLFSSNDLEDAQLGLESVEGSSEIQYVVAVNGMELGSKRNSVSLENASGNNLDDLLSLNVKRETGGVATNLPGGSIVPLAVDMPLSTTQSSQQPPASFSAAYGSNSQASKGENVHHTHASQPPASLMQHVDRFSQTDGKSANSLSSKTQPSQPPLASSPAPYESNSLVYQGQKVHHVHFSHRPLSSTQHKESLPQTDGKGSNPMYAPVQHDCQTSNFARSSESLVSMPLQGYAIQQPGLIEDPNFGGFHVQNTEVSLKDTKLKRDNSGQTLNEPKIVQTLDKEAPIKELKVKQDTSFPQIQETVKIQTFENENKIVVHTYDSSARSNYVAREEIAVAKLPPEIRSHILPTKTNRKPQEIVENSVSPETAKEWVKNDDDKYLYSSGGPSASGCGCCEADQSDFFYLEPSLVPQRVFHSERIPREQAELNRLSKSDDSFDPQVLISQARLSSPQTVAELVDKLHERNEAPQAEQSLASSKPNYADPQTVEEGLAQFEKYNGFPDNFSKLNANLSEGLESSGQKSQLGPKIFNAVDSYEIAKGKDNYGDHSLKNKEAAQGEPPVGVATLGQGDMSVDINNQLPLDILSDKFLKVRMHENLSGISPMPIDRTGLSLKIENHEPKHWSFFRNLAQDQFVRKDVLLIDQDDPGLSTSLANVEGGPPVDYSYPALKSDGVASPHIDTQVIFDGDKPHGMAGPIETNTMNPDADYSHSQFKGKDNVQLGGLDSRVPESEYQHLDEKYVIETTVVPQLDLPLGDFDIRTLQIIKNEDLEELRELGSGTFGTVYHGKWRGSDVAIKRIKKSCFAGRSTEQERLTLEFWREADILLKLHHPNVVAFYGVVQDGPGGTLATVTEFMVNGSLRHVLLSKDRSYLFYAYLLSMVLVHMNYLPIFWIS